MKSVLIFADICATTTTEGYTPLHLAARYNPHNDYDSATRKGTDGDYSQTTPGNNSSNTVEEAMRFLITQVNVSFHYKFLSIITLFC